MGTPRWADALLDHAFKNWLDNKVSTAVSTTPVASEELAHRHHPTSVGTLVTIVGTFVVLRCWHNGELIPIDKGKERELFR